MRLLLRHLVYLILKVLVWKMCNMKVEFAKKAIIHNYSLHIMCGSNFYESDFRKFFQAIPSCKQTPQGSKNIKMLEGTNLCFWGILFSTPAALQGPTKTWWGPVPMSLYVPMALYRAKPGQSGLGKLSPACAAPPAPPAPRQALPWRNLCGSKSAHSSRQRQARRAERHACAAPSCLAWLSLPVPRACATALHYAT